MAKKCTPTTKSYLHNTENSVLRELSRIEWNLHGPFCCPPLNPDQMDKIEELRAILIPRIPQFSGKKRLVAARNVSLLSTDWFQALGLYLEGKSMNSPGPIENTLLQEMLALDRELVEGRDFEIVESNVYEFLAKMFGGGPQIQRPFLPNPSTHQGDVVLKPIKFRITMDGEEIARTVNPTWTSEEIKMIVAKHVKKDAADLILWNFETNRIIPDSISAKEILAQFGPRLKILQKIKMPGSQSSPLYFDHQSPVTAGSVCAGSTNSRTTAQNAIQSCVIALMQAVAALPPVVAHVRDDGTEFGAYINQGTICNVTEDLLQFMMETAKLGSHSRLNLAGILSNLVDFMHARDVFGFQAMQTLQCKKCKQKKEVVQELIALDCDLRTKSSKKVKLEECIDKWCKGVESGECEKCKSIQKMKSRVAVEALPPVLAFTFKKQREAGAGKIAPVVIMFPPEFNAGKLFGGPAAMYKLYAVVSFYGHIMNQRFKTCLYQESENRWMIANEARLRPIESSLVFSSDNGAVALFYVRK